MGKAHMNAIRISDLTVPMVSYLNRAAPHYTCVSAHGTWGAHVAMGTWTSCTDLFDILLERDAAADIFIQGLTFTKL